MEIDDKLTLIEIWDTTGQERFAKLASSYYKKAMGVMLSYAVNDRTSFERVEFWMNQVLQQSTESISKMLIATKEDLPENERKVSFDEGNALAQKYGIKFFETSAKSGLNVNEAFCAMAKEVIEINPKCLQKVNEGNMQKSNGGQSNVKLNQPPANVQRQSNGCC